MQQASTVAQEPSFGLDFVSKLANFALETRSRDSAKGGYSLSSSNFVSFNGFSIPVAKNRQKGVASSVSLSSAQFRSGFSVGRFISEFNRAIGFHCERIPIGFASLGFGSESNGSDSSVQSDGNGVREAGFGVVEDDGLVLNGVVAEKQKRVLILMSDTGGGHRASAEAIKAAFYEEFGDEYQVFVTDLWTDHTPWPFNQLPKTYSFLVKHGPLWKFTYYASAPRIIHQSNFAATSTFIAREVAKGLMKYQPDIIISVHPLMQHVPLRILRARGLLEKIIFTTVVTDLSTCHPTWFHKLVTRCYCPSMEVAKRAQKAGLQPSQIKVFGLPVRPSFVKPVRPKVNSLTYMLSGVMLLCFLGFLVTALLPN